MSAAWPAAPACSNARVKAARQSRSRSRSASVTDARQACVGGMACVVAQADIDRAATTSRVRMPSSLSGGPAAVHRQVRAGDGGGAFAGQVKRQAGDLVDADEALGRLGGQ